MDAEKEAIEHIRKSIGPDLVAKLEGKALLLITGESSPECICVGDKLEEYLSACGVTVYVEHDFATAAHTYQVKTEKHKNESHQYYSFIVIAGLDQVKAMKGNDAGRRNVAFEDVAEFASKLRTHLLGPAYDYAGLIVSDISGGEITMGHLKISLWDRSNLSGAFNGLFGLLASNGGSTDNNGPVRQPMPVSGNNLHYK